MTNGEAPATKSDIERIVSLIERLDQKLDQSVAQLRSEASDNYNHLVERVRDGEVRVLKTFYDLMEALQARADDLEDSRSAMISRMGSLETRVIELEKRLNMPRSN